MVDNQFCKDFISLNRVGVLPIIFFWVKSEEWDIISGCDENKHDIL